MKFYTDEAVPFGEKPEPKLERAMWTGILLVAMSLVIFIIYCIQSIRLMYCSTVPSYMMSGLLGTGVYFLMQNGKRQNKIAAGLMVTFVLVSSFIVSGCYFLTSFVYYGSGIDFNSFLANLIRKLLCAIFASGGAILFHRLLKNRTQKERIRKASLYTALLVLLDNIILMPNKTAAALLGTLLYSVVLFLTPPALNALCTMDTKPIELSAWGQLWLCICMIGSLCSAILCIVLPDSFYSSQLILNIAALIGSVMLLRQKRTGWFVILFSVVIIIGGQFSSALISLLHGYTENVRPLLGAIYGAANPVITWLSIRKAWHEENRVISNEYTTAI